jgi:hypothetical protein
LSRVRPSLFARFRRELGETLLPEARRGRIHSATPTNGTYDAALITKHAVAPTLDISTPAIDGPRMRERLNCVELSARPRSISSRLTIDGTID